MRGGDDVHDQPTVLLSTSMIAEAQSAEPCDEPDDTSTDTRVLCDASVGGGTTIVISSSNPSSLVTSGPISSGEITAQTARGLESEPPPSARSAARSSFAERLDEEIDHVTAEVPRRSSVADPAPAGGSSSDPPTRFLRGIDPHIELPSGSVVDDNYEIDAKIGVGAMGVVYSATDARLGRRVALKVIAPTLGADPQARARFEREARALASLHHPGIVGIHAFGELADGRHFFVMEHLDGEALDERLARGRVPLDEALDVVDQMSGALEAAHAQGIVHRDLKPSNTFLARPPREERPVVKLLDFGLSKLSVSDGVEGTASGIVIGTPLYLSPEQARGPDVDHRTDIYALGCVAFELLLGRHPFPDARTPTAAIAAHLTEAPPQPRTIWPEIPPALDHLMSSMLSKDPDHRPTLAQVRGVVTRVRAQVTAGRATRRSTAASTRRALHVRARPAALVALVLIIGIVISTRLLGGRARGGNAASTSSIEISAPSPRDASEASVVSEPPVPAVAPERVPDAVTEPRRAPAANPTKLPRPRPPRPPIVTTTIDAAIPAPPPEPIDAGTTPDADPPSRERAASDGVQPRVAFPMIKPAARAVPRRPTKPPGRDDVINPFGKRGSAAR